MEGTPVIMLGKKFPLSMEEIEETSEKWEKRTKKMVTKWPKEGTFDVSVCEEMDTVIERYKTEK